MASSTDFKPDREVMLTDSFEIGSKPACDYCINDDQVTDLHAVISRKKGATSIRDRGSRTGTLVNNRPITDARLATGDWISIGPTMFQFLDDRLAVYTRGRMYRIDGSDLTRSVQVIPETGGPPVPLVLIDDVTITVEPGEFTAIIGPSGSGKSTLLNALSARVPADAGSVAINGKDLISHFDELKRSIVLVPQKETIHEPLTVRAILTHTARLRMPPGTSRAALVREVNRVLGVVDLPEEQHHSAFGTLSGGQKKRVCLANELIGNPQIIFLDEVTSGLDEEADGRMMALFRKLADGGKTVIGITHNLANVERFCNRVIVLARGGRLVFTGSAAETKAYFEVPQLGDVYRRLEQDEPPDAPAPAPGSPAAALTGKVAKAEAWRLAYERQAPRVQDRAGITARKSATAVAAGGMPEGRPDEESPFRRILSQTAALVRRYTDLQLIDRYNLISMAGTSILVAALLVIVFGNVNVGSEGNLYKPATHDGPMLMFLVLFSCMWFGCTAAAKEVIKEADIYRMERNHSLDLTAYYLSKLSVLSVLALIQAALLYLPVKVLCDPDGAFIPQVITVAGITLVGVMLGLVISSAAKTVDAAATLVPVVVIPQFILAGAVMAVSGLAKFLAVFAALYWGYKGVLASEPDFFHEAIGELPDWFPAHLMLIVHAGVYLAAGWFLLRMKDKGQTTGDLIHLTRMAMSDPSGPAARYLSTAKASLVSVSKIRLPADLDLSMGLSALPRLVRRKTGGGMPAPAMPTGQMPARPPAFAPPPMPGQAPAFLPPRTPAPARTTAFPTAAPIAPGSAAPPRQMPPPIVVTAPRPVPPAVPPAIPPVPTETPL